MQQLNESSNGQEIELSCGQRFEIRLPENPTTGFRWSIVSNGEPACIALDNAYEPPDALAHGQEGTHYWRFETAQAGEGTIELVYQRSWEHGKNPARRFTLHVRVKE
jgi:inhibitor of cysteine peptidase